MQTPEPPGDRELDALLAYLHERRHFDFRGYKRASLVRRIAKRMDAVGAESYPAYTEVLEANPSEFAELFNTILINVTSLRRDPQAWEFLAQAVIPAIIKGKERDEAVRVWSAGCASGEEAYSLAVLFADALGEERFRRVVKIYATDADSDALVTARHGRYKEQYLLDAFGENTANRYFALEGGYGVLRAELRRSMIFGRHDLVQDPPISRIDLVACRNTLMYLTSEVQLGVLARLHFSLNPGGYLFLGASEALVSRPGGFEVVNLRHRVFRKDGPGPDPMGFPASGGRVQAEDRQEGSVLSDVIAESSPVPQVVVDTDMNIVMANRGARRLLSLGPSEGPRPLREAELALRPVDLRTPIGEVLRTRQPERVDGVVCDTGPEAPLALDLLISPLDTIPAVAIAFLDVTRYQHLRHELGQSQRELESAYEELQSAVEELETTNEELQSINEELETTNEELHSTNEELETMNEELHSTNEELEATNTELRLRSAEVDELNVFLQSILGSLRSAVIVLDADMQVRAWNSRAEELWGLRSDEVVGRHFLNLDIGFPIDTLRNEIRACLAGSAEQRRVVQPAVSRRGRPVKCTVELSSLARGEETAGVLILMFAEPYESPSQDGQAAISLSTDVQGRPDDVAPPPDGQSERTVTSGG